MNPYRPSPPIHRMQPSPSGEPRRLPMAQPPHEFNVLIDYTDTMSTFYEALASVNPPENVSDSFEDRLLSLSCDDVVQMAIQALGDMVCRGSQVMESGVGYFDVAQLMRQVPVRETLWPYSAVDLVYRPSPTPTEQYHLDLMEDNVANAIHDLFQGCGRVTTEAMSDVIVWRAVVATLLDTARAIVTAGRILGMTENALMCYAIEQAFPAKDHQGRVGNAYIYVISLRGP